MPIPRRALLTAPLLAAPAIISPILARSPWPSRPLRFVVPFAPGGPVELPARLIAEHLGGRLGQPVVVELKPGAAGAIGCREVVQATDVHSFLFMTGGLAVLPSLQKDPGFDIHRDLAPISLVNEMPMAVVVRADSPLRDMAGGVGPARAGPGRLFLGSSRPGPAPPPPPVSVNKARGP